MATILGVLLGVLGNALYDLAGWAAGRLVVVAAAVRRRYRGLSELHKIEYFYAITRVPTHALKLLTAAAILLIAVGERLADETVGGRESQTPDARPTTRRSVGVAGGSALAIFIACGITALTPSAAGATITGSASCVAGPLVGAWLEAPDGGSGFVNLEYKSSQSALFSYSLETSGPYSMHVGCEGSSAEWETVNFSPPTTALNPELVCMVKAPNLLATNRWECLAFGQKAASA